MVTIILSMRWPLPLYTQTHRAHGIEQTAITESYHENDHLILLNGLGMTPSLHYKHFVFSTSGGRRVNKQLTSVVLSPHKD